VLDKKGSLRLNVTDIFYTNRATLGVTYPGLDVHFYNYPETRIIRLNFTYSIGKAGQAMRKRNGQDEERKGWDKLDRVYEIATCIDHSG